tara:strand:+ start:210 stop:413 length:204 start_codon:yes stop_codon:yes gene_type:complete
MPILTHKKTATKINPNRIERLWDELELAAMRKRDCGRKMSLGEMSHGSDEAAERAFERMVTAYDGGN